MDEKRQSGGAGPHVGTKRLIAYRQGTLAEAEHEAVQEHLSLCPRCAGLLLELRDFEADAARDSGPAPRQAWESFVRRLPAPAPAPPPPRRIPRFLYAAAAALLLALLGLSAWMAVTAQRSRERLTHLEQQLKQREDALAALRRSLGEAERQLDAARGQSSGRVAELEARVAALTSDLEQLRASQPVVASRQIEALVAPRFALRGQEPGESGFLQGNGAVNPVLAREGRFTLALSLAGHPAYAEYRLALFDGKGKALWSARQPGKALLGDAGTSIAVNGLSPGRYRLRVEGLQPGRADLLAEYLLAVERAD
ncbi:MAG: zf-HC2 domain-containing protein [Thermoanaerobaculia bacterium]